MQSAHALTLTNLTTDDVDVMGSSLATFDTTDNVWKLNGDQTLDATKNYILTDKLFVDNGDTLTIPAGTKIYSTLEDQGTSDKADDEFGAIVVTRGSNIEALGTSAQPIVMTTINALEADRGQDIDGDSVVASAPTKDDRGLWGGLIVLGEANVYNYSAPGVRIGENAIEGFAPAAAPDDDNDGRVDIIEYGGSDDADDSGTIQYVSIRHGGYEFAAGDEINGLTLGGVGSGTTIDHVEVLSNSDDGIEFFGGTVDMKYALVSFVKDDALDIDEGYTGRIQYVCVLQTTTVGSVEDSDHGGEWDGNDGGDDGDVVSAPVISNVTFIGDNEGDHGLKFDDFYAGELYNSVVTNFADLLTVTGDGTLAAPPTITNVSTDVSNALEGDNNTVESFVAGQFDTVSDVELNQIDLASFEFDPRPALTSPLLSSTVTDLNASDSFFDVTSYRGAFDASTNWALGWTGTDAYGHFVDVASGGDFASFATQYGVVGGPTDDDDSDGLSNDYERLFGLDPTSASSVAPVTSNTVAADGKVSYTRRDDALTGASYEVYYSTDLSGWTLDSAASQVAGAVDADNVETVEVTLSNAALATAVDGRLFVRIEAVTGN
jgi:hypothetical protein